MSEAIAFKGGKDLGEEARTVFLDTVQCEECGQVESEEKASEDGWHFDPVLCGLCFGWTLTDEGERCAAGDSMMRVTVGERLGPCTVLGILANGIAYADPYSKGAVHYCPLKLVPGLTYFSGFRGMFTDFYDRMFARDGEFFRHVPWWTSPELPLPQTDEVMYWIEFERDNMRVLSYRDEIVDCRGQLTARVSRVVAHLSHEP